MHRFLFKLQEAHLPLSEGDVATIRQTATQHQRLQAQVLVEVPAQPDEEGSAPGEEPMAKAGHVAKDH